MFYRWRHHWRTRRRFRSPGQRGSDAQEWIFRGSVSRPHLLGTELHLLLCLRLWRRRRGGHRHSDTEWFFILSSPAVHVIHGRQQCSFLLWFFIFFLSYFSLDLIIFFLFGIVFYCSRFGWENDFKLDCRTWTLHLPSMNCMHQATLRSDLINLKKKSDLIWNSNLEFGMI